MHVKGHGIERTGSGQHADVMVIETKQGYISSLVRQQINAEHAGGDQNHADTIIPAIMQSFPSLIVHFVRMRDQICFLLIT